MVIAITTAVSGGFTFWLYTAHDGAFVGRLLFSDQTRQRAVLPLQRDLQHVAQLRQRDGHTGSNLLQL